jgi:hypothetical protein
MLIIGCDFHPGFQQVAIFDNLTGEIQEKRLQHRAEAEQFYPVAGRPRNTSRAGEPESFCARARLKIEGRPWSGSQKLSTSEMALWQNPKLPQRRVATKRLPRCSVVRDRMTNSRMKG